jgi:predicted Holliday junction resolvase-like endonuclease
MENNMKNWFIILVILCLILLIGNISSCNSAYRNKTARDKEMFSRLDLEEKMSKVGKQISDLEEKLKEKEKDLLEEKVVQDALKKSLAEEKLANETLKGELEKLNELKKTLEEDLKEALAKKK